MLTTCREEKVSWFRSLRDAGFEFPNTYLVFDLETTGQDVCDTLILEFGCLVVVDGEIHERPVSQVLNWTIHPDAESRLHILEQRMRSTKTDMVRRGSRYDFDLEKLRSGVYPTTLLRNVCSTFKKWQSAGHPFMGHNGLSFDCRHVELHFKQFLNDEFKFDTAKFLDTGLIHKSKAIVEEQQFMPKDGAMLPFYCDVANTRSFETWKLGECVKSYGLDVKYGIDLSKMHTAAHDCLATHYLYQEMRKLAFS